tara:strand:- start:207 stop:995 length:789 start_codon:yes stop_codon:yes gene_type:complete
MKKYLVIGNPIEHSLSPKLHNFWLNENNIKAIYDKEQLNENNLESIIQEIKNGKIDGINVTIPFKKSILPFLDQLTPVAKETQSVNTVFKKDNKVFGDNTDVEGFRCALKHINYNAKNKKIFILGAGGVVTSIIKALKRIGVSEIILSNRTKKKADVIKEIYPDLKIVEWGETPDFDMIINATSLGLKKTDEIKLNYKKLGPHKLFYDIIYNPAETNFLIEAKKFGNQVENGRMMFIYQAQLSFKIWHNILPKINQNLLIND